MDSRGYAHRKLEVPFRSAVPLNRSTIVPVRGTADGKQYCDDAERIVSCVHYDRYSNSIVPNAVTKNKGRNSAQLLPLPNFIAGSLDSIVKAMVVSCQQQDEQL